MESPPLSFYKDRRHVAGRRASDPVVEKAQAFELEVEHHLNIFRSEGEWVVLHWKAPNWIRGSNKDLKAAIDLCVAEIKREEKTK